MSEPRPRPLARGALTAALAILAALILAALCLPQPRATAAAGQAQAPSAKREAAKQRAAKQRAAKRGAAKRKLRQRPAYWGAWIGDPSGGSQPPWDMSGVSALERLTGRGLSLIQFSSPFADCSSLPCSFYDFPAGGMQTIREYGAIPVFSWGSQATPVSENLRQPEFRLANILAGHFDAYIRRFAEEARAWGHPFFLRFNWEMNGDWFTWSEQRNGNRPGDSVATWRHVHDIFREVGATNATWVWCPYADPHNRHPTAKRFYPGNSYVDWTCLDGYNWGPNSVNPHPWRNFDQIFASSYRQLITRIAPRKPVMIAEIASLGGPKPRARWIRRMFAQIATKYRRVRGLIWFEQIDRGLQWPLGASPGAARAFALALRERAFRGSAYSALQGQPIRPPAEHKRSR